MYYTQKYSYVRVHTHLTFCIHNLTHADMDHHLHRPCHIPSMILRILAHPTLPSPIQPKKASQQTTSSTSRISMRWCHSPCIQALTMSHDTKATVIHDQISHTRLRQSDQGYACDSSVQVDTMHSQDSNQIKPSSTNKDADACEFVADRFCAVTGLGGRPGNAFVEIALRRC